MGRHLKFEKFKKHLQTFFKFQKLLKISLTQLIFLKFKFTPHPLKIENKKTIEKKNKKNME